MAAIAFVTVRKLSATEPTLRIVSYFAIVGLSISAIPLIWTWQTQSGKPMLDVNGSRIDYNYRSIIINSL